MDIYRKIRDGCNFITLKKFYDILKNGNFCKMVILVIFCKNLICSNMVLFVKW